jgi:hypothetical protein
MRKSHALVAVIATLVLLTAFSAQAAEGVQLMGHGVTKLMEPHRLELQQSKLLVETSIVKHGEIEEPLGQAKRKDTTSAGISRSAGEPKKNSAERVSPEATSRVTERKEESDSKFGIYRAIKESVLDFLLPSRKRSAEKVDLSRLQKDGRTESTKTAAKSQPVR